MAKRIVLYLAPLFALLVGCSDNDTFSTSSSHLLSFDVDTLKLDTAFSTVPSRTYTFWVHNHNDDGLRLTSVRLKKGNQTGFRINVDGTYLDNAMGSMVSDL
jgi:hypothetical protein